MKSPVSDVKVKIEGRGGGAGKTMVVVAGKLLYFIISSEFTAKLLVKLVCGMRCYFLGE